MIIRQNRPAQMAKQVLESLWDGFLPINLDALASRLGLLVIRDETLNLQGFSGAYENGEGRPLVRINPSDSVRRQRFTFAHEIGHHVLGHGSRPRDPAANFSMSADPVEREANQFAAELLMPGDALKHVVRIEGVRDISTLAKRFGVSEVAMSYRLKNLRLI